MSREIKFRAWDKKQKKMLYAVSIGTIKVWDENAPLISHEFSYSEDCIFEQYTGLKDKNGKEIYEGDIVKMPDWTVRLKFEVVRFTKLACGFEPFVNGCMGCCSPDGEEVEVIGNIHESPELFGGEE